jgi:hypothetical protein
VDDHKSAQLAAHAPVEVTLIAPEPRRVSGRVLSVSARDLLLRLPLDAPAGSIVRIDGDDSLLLGEIQRSEPSGDEWRVSVRVYHSLSGLAELERLNRALLRATPKPESVETK